MTPGFHAESVPVDIGGSPAMRVCERMAALFGGDTGLSSNVTLAVTPQGPKDLWVSMLHAQRRRTGAAGRALDALVLLCDMHGATIRLQAVSLTESIKDAEGALGQNDLDAFYGRRGFVPDDANWRAYAMIRTPRAPVLPERMRTSRPCTAPTDLQGLHSLLGTPMVSWRRNAA